MITVSELIDQLQRHPGDMRVIMPGYEGGFMDVTGMEQVNIKLNYNTEWCYGPHTKVSGYESDETALCIGGLDGR